MPDDLYERDIVLWCDAQAALMRRLAAGERVNADVDWANVIEEIEAVGRTERRAAESLVERAIGHLMKIVAEPTGPVDHWRAEIRVFLKDAARAYSPAMRRLIDWQLVYERAWDDVVVPAQWEARISAVSPFAPEELIVDRVTAAHIDMLLAKLREHANAR